MPLEIDDAKLVGADRHVDATLFAFRQNGEPCRLQLGAADIIVSRVRYVKACIDVTEQRVIGLSYPMGVHAPSLSGQPLSFDAVECLDDGVRGQARTEHRGDVF